MGRVKFTEWNGDKYPEYTQQCLQKFAPVIGAQFQEEIKTPQFNWPNDTQRRSGEFVRKGRRDIVDLGNFAGSQMPGKVVGKNRLVFEWTAAYALAIFVGYYSNQFQKQKARDWVSPGLKNQSMLQFFVRTWLQTGK
jgi:hypothetical protein